MIQTNIRCWGVLMSSLKIISVACWWNTGAVLHTRSLLTCEVASRGKPLSQGMISQYPLGPPTHTCIYPLPSRPDTHSHILNNPTAADSSRNLISTKPNNGRSNITDVICLSLCVCVHVRVCYCIPYVWMPVACLLNACMSCGPYIPCITYCVCHVYSGSHCFSSVFI